MQGFTKNIPLSKIFGPEPLNKLSRGEICVANFIPPANGASRGNYFQAKIPKMAVFEAKTG